MDKVVLEITEKSKARVFASLKEVPKTASDRIQRVLGEGGLVIQKDTISPASFPVITGNLRASYQIDLKEGEVSVYSELDYAPAVEFGSRPHAINSVVYMPGIGFRYIGMHPGGPPQPHLVPAFERNSPRIEAAISKALEKL